MSKGVGLKFEGYPTDEEQFFHILAGESCHPRAAARILVRIKENGFDLLTVMMGLNFFWVQDCLFQIGVKMSFVPPQEDWHNKYPDNDWTKDTVSLIAEERERLRL